MLQSTLQCMYISEHGHYKEASRGTQDKEAKTTAVGVLFHCLSWAPHIQDDGNLPLVLWWGLLCLRASTQCSRAMGHLSLCSALRGFLQPLQRAGGSEICRSCREMGLFSCEPCNNGQVISVAVYQTIHSTIMLSRCCLLFFSLPRFTVL